MSLGPCGSSQARFRTFANGEISVKLEQSVSNYDVFVVPGQQNKAWIPDQRLTVLCSMQSHTWAGLGGYYKLQHGVGAKQHVHFTWPMRPGVCTTSVWVKSGSSRSLRVKWDCSYSSFVCYRLWEAGRTVDCRMLSDIGCPGACKPSGVCAR